MCSISWKFVLIKQLIKARVPVMESTESGGTCCKLYSPTVYDLAGSKNFQTLRCVKARVQNLMKSGIQNLICMHFNLSFCKNHNEV